MLICPEEREVTEVTEVLAEDPEQQGKRLQPFRKTPEEREEPEGEVLAVRADKQTDLIF